MLSQAVPPGAFACQPALDPGQLVVTNLALDRLLQMAFRVSPPEISGPDWLSSVYVDIAAKYPAGSTEADRAGMM